MREYVDPDTGEVFALISLADWQRISIVAKHTDTDNAGSCHCAGCTLASMVTVAGGGCSTLDTWNAELWTEPRGSRGGTWVAAANCADPACADPA